MVGRSVAAGAIGILAVVLLMAGGAPRPVEAASVTVTSVADSGAGSFRKAVELANGDPSINLIVLKNWLPITLTSPVIYTGQQALTIQGDQSLNYRTIQGWPSIAGNPEVEPLECGLFVSAGGADITLHQVAFQNSWCDAVNIAAVYPDDAMTINLSKVSLRNNFGSGLYVREAGDAYTAVTLNISASSILGNGRCRGASGCAFGGVEVEGESHGDAYVTVNGSTFLGNGGNGLYIDRRPNPDPVSILTLAPTTTLSVSNSSFNENGKNVIAAASSGGPSVANHQDGDGIGVQALDSGYSDVSVDLTNVQANGNARHGVHVEETDSGDVDFEANGLTASGNGDQGLHLSERGQGSLVATLKFVATWANADDGAFIEELEAGNLELMVQDSSANWNGDDGYDFDQLGGGGDLDASFTRFQAIGNAHDGIAGEQNGSDSFEVRIGWSTIYLNDNDAVDLRSDSAPATVVIESSVILGAVDLDGVTQLF